MVAVRHVVFDVGRVLLHWDPEVPYRRLIPDDAQRRWFLESVCSPAWNTEQDRGRPWEEGEALLVTRHPAHEEHIRAFRRHWSEMVPHALDDTVDLFDALLERGVDVTLLTNFAADTFAVARARFPLLDRARGATVSGEVGVVKPDPEVYALHAARFGLDPELTLFVDDSPANVEGARAAGWRAVRFVGAPALAEQLASHGLLP